MNSILELVQKYNFDQLARTESGNAVLYCSPEDYRELRTLSARLAATEENLERETALLTEARQQNADLMAIIDKRDEALGFIPLDKGMDMQDELRETKARLAEAEHLILRMAGEDYQRARFYVEKYDLTGERAAVSASDALP